MQYGNELNTGIGGGVGLKDHRIYGSAVNPPNETTVRPSQISDVLAHINEELIKQSSLIEHLAKKLTTVIRNEPSNAPEKRDVGLSYSAQLPQELNNSILQRLIQYNKNINDIIQLIEL